MSSTIVWVLVLGASAVALVFLAANDQRYSHAAICALVALGIAVSAARDNQKALAASMPVSEISALNALYMATIWAWGAIVMALTYVFVLSWKEWWHFVLGFAVAAIICGLFARMLKESKGGSEQQARLLQVSRYLAIAQLVGMVITMVGLVADKKMDAIGLTPFGPRNNPPMDWAGNNAFFFGALGLIIVSWIALRSHRQAGNAA